MSDTHEHWEFDSECPHCGKVNHVKAPVGETMVVVHCEHCTHSYDYLHVVTKHITVKDEE